VIKTVMEYLTLSEIKKMLENWILNTRCCENCVFYFYFLTFKNYLK